MSPGGTDGRLRREAVAAWLALTAPGALVTCATITLALVLVPVITPLVVVSPAVRYGAGGLLLLHAAVTGILVLTPSQWMALLFLALLAADALLCGALLSAQWHGPAPLFAFAVVVISLEVGGWVAAAICVVGTAVGVVAATWSGIASMVLVPAAMSFPTTLAVETSFGGSVVAGATTSQPTALSVETWIGGMPAFASWEELLVPTLTLVLAALYLGLATSLWRVRKARSAVAASIMAAARVTA
jgi:hypothetical protein